MKLIDADALAKHIKDLPTWWADDGGVYPGGSMKYPDGMYYPEDIISSIDNAPTVDAVEVPCKIGDSLWCVYSPPYPANPADKGKWYMGEFEVARFHYGAKGLSIEMYGFGTVAGKEIGKTAFLSRKEAEAALAKMDGGNEDG